MLLIARNVCEQPGNIPLAPHYAVEEPEDPTLWGAGEEFANVETLDNAIASMCCGVGDVASPLHRAEKELWRADPGQHLRQSCLNPLQRLARVFDMPNAVARLLRNIKFGIKPIASGQGAQIGPRNAQQRSQLGAATHLV